MEKKSRARLTVCGSTLWEEMPEQGYTATVNRHSIRFIKIGGTWAAEIMLSTGKVRGAYDSTAKRALLSLIAELGSRMRELSRAYVALENARVNGG